MRTISFLSVPLLCTVVLFAADKHVSYNVKYAGGSFQNVKSGQELKMFLNQDQIRFEPPHRKDVPIIIPAKTITEVNFGNEVHRRVGTAIGVGAVTFGLGSLIALSHSKKHYIGLVWNGGNGKKGGMVVQADKNEYRGIIAALEGLTGKEAIDTDTDIVVP